MDTNTNSSLAQKEAMLAKAEAMVAELRNQVAALRNAAKPSEFETLFAAHTPNSVQPTLSTKSVSEQVSIQNLAMPENGKNDKGSVSKTILEVLSNGQPKTVEEVMSEVNKLLDKPTTRGSVRGTLSNLSSANKVTKTAYGEYSIPTQKGESPATANSEAFNSQPSPAQGQ
jgi:hypothetical protein